jgi:flagellar assembly protein FliH
VRPEFVLPVVQEAIRALPHFSQHARLVLNPEDGALVRAHLGDQLAQSGWQLVEDARMQRGGCRIETAHGQIDASLASRWHRVLAALGQDSRWLE